MRTRTLTLALAVLSAGSATPAAAQRGAFVYIPQHTHLLEVAGPPRLGRDFVVELSAPPHPRTSGLLLVGGLRTPVNMVTGSCTATCFGYPICTRSGLRFCEPVVSYPLRNAVSTGQPIISFRFPIPPAVSLIGLGFALQRVDVAFDVVCGVNYETYGPGGYGVVGR